MTVASTVSRKSYAGDGVTTSFDTNPVVFFDSADLTVSVITTATSVVVATLVEDTDYTVSGGDGTTGTINTAAGSVPYGAPASGTTLLIVRELDIVQEADFVNNDPSDAEVAEDVVDKITMMLQQLNTRLERSFALADTDVSGASTEIPTPAATSLIGWNTAATALQNYTTDDLDIALTTAFTLTLLDDTTAAEARTTLGFPTIAAKGDLIMGSAAGTMTAKTIGLDGYRLTPSSGATGGGVWAPVGLGFTLDGGYLDYSVSASALTIAIKTWAGNNPSDAEPVFIVFRSSTVATGLPVIRKITAATSVVVSSGSTLGTVANIAFRVWVVAFDDAGTVRLAAINCLTTVAGAGAGRDVTAIFPLRGWSIASSTAEGGAGAADSAQTFYTGTAVAAKAYATLGFATWETGLGTAGTWSAGPTRAQLWGPREPLPGDTLQAQRNETGAVATGTTVMPIDDTIPQSTEGDQYMSQALTPTSAANALRVRSESVLASNIAGYTMGCALYQDATANALAAVVIYGAVNGANIKAALDKLLLAATTAATTFKVRAGANAAGTTTFNGSGGARYFLNAMNSFIDTQEIMA